MTVLILVLFLLLIMFVLAWRSNPNRRKNIDANIRKIVNSETEISIRIDHASKALENEYKYQFKSYKKHAPDIKCYRDPENSNVLILARG